jgi:hypothetical protein
MVPVSVFITCIGAASGYTALPADHEFPVFLQFSGEKITLFGDRGLLEAVRQKGTDASQQSRTGAAVCSKEEKEKSH